MKKILVGMMAFLLIAGAAQAGTSIWGATDRGPAVGTMRFPVDTGASSGPGYLSVTEMNTFVKANGAGGSSGDIQYNNSGALGGITPGTGVVAALGVNVGSAGAPVLFNGAGGNPSSLTLTSGTGLPLTTGVTGTLPIGNGGTGVSNNAAALSIFANNSASSAAPGFYTSPIISGSYGTQQSINATSTDGLLLNNPGPATVGAQKWSPRIHLEGQGWKTNATAGSEQTDVILEVQPVQGTADPTFNLVWSGQVNVAGYTPFMQYTSATGVLSVGGSAVQTAATTAQTKIKTIGFSATTPTTGIQGTFAVAPCAGTITAFDIIADAGTATVQTYKIATGTTAPTVSNSISTAGVQLSTGTAIHSTSLGDFTTLTVAANDMFQFNLSAVATATKLYFDIQITCTN